MTQHFRSRTGPILMWYVFFCCGLGLVASISQFSEGRRGAACAPLALAIGFACYGWFVARRLGVDVDDNGFALHGLLGVKAVPYDRTDRFEMQHSSPWSAILVTTEGERIVAYGLGASGFRHKASQVASQQLVDELNEIIRSRHN